MGDDQLDGYGTRRETTAPASDPSVTSSQPWLTRREAAAAASGIASDTGAEPTVTRRESDAFSTRREGLAEDPDMIIGLPAVLRSKYAVVNELPNPGTEADVLLVRDLGATGLDGDDRRVVKLYRQGIRAEQEVWAKVRLMTSPHVVRIVDTGTAAGRDYEVMEFLPGGNLTELAPPGTGLPVRTVTEMVRQVAAALIELHRQGILHRDLKPENVLIRRTDPLELVVTDFGLSRVHEQSMVAASRSGTMAYLAPEILLSTGAVSSKARDWWALGMMVREMLTGVRPFEEMTARGIDRALMLRGVDLGNIDDPRIRLLCRGLLVRDLEDRWGAQQVQEWLNGGSPEVRDEGSGAADELKPFIFEGQPYREKRALARAFGRSWEKAARRYFVAMGTEADSSEGWLALRTWLQQFSNPEMDDVEGLVELIDEHLKPTSIAPDVKLLSLLRWLDPKLPAVYRGQSVSREHLASIAAQGANGSGGEQAAASRIVGDLHGHRLLPVLAQMQDGDGLAVVDRDWREQLARCDAQVAKVAPGLPAPARDALATTDAGRYRSELLLLALDPVGRSRQLREAVADRTRTLPEPVPWFQQLVSQGDGGDLVGDLLGIIVFPAAAAQSQQLAAEKKQQDEAERALREVWERHESARLAGAEVAAKKAWIYVGSVLAVMSVLFLLDLGRGIVISVISVLAGLAVGAYLVVSELEFARKLGTDYADFTVLSGAGSRIQGIGERIRGIGAGAGFGLLIAIIVVFILGVTVPFVPYAAIGGAQAWNLGNRRARWQERHDAERHDAQDAWPGNQP